jgi:nucleotide-binding universal stress UspA family protein
MKKIIVGIDGSKESFNSYHCALKVFPEEKINLVSVFVRDKRKTQIPFIYSGAAYDIAYERLYIPADPHLLETYEKLNAENKVFAKECIKMCDNIETGDNIIQSGVILEGDPADSLKHYSKDCDLLVLGQRGENSAYVRELIGSTTEDLIRKSSVPVLICPGDNINLNRILMVYEDSPSSDNAIDYYLRNFVSLNNELLILAKDHFDDMMQIISEKTTNLKNSGVKVSIEKCHGSIAHRAIEIMENSVIDTFILGSHGKHKLTEYLLGSTTIHIIRKSSVPVFIVH